MRKLSIVWALAIAGNAWADQGTHGGSTSGGALPPHLFQWDQSDINAKLLRAMARDARKYRGEPIEEDRPVEIRQAQDVDPVQDAVPRRVEQIPIGEVWATDPTKNSGGFLARQQANNAQAQVLINRAREARIMRNYGAMDDVQTDIQIFRAKNPEWGRR